MEIERIPLEFASDAEARDAIEEIRTLFEVAEDPTSGKAAVTYRVLDGEPPFNVVNQVGVGSAGS